jgi:flagellar basal body-associated protein FliL
MKNKRTLWIIVIVAAVVASLATLATLMLRFKCKKRRALKPAADDGCACMSFDCEHDDEPMEKTAD